MSADELRDAISKAQVEILNSLAECEELTAAAYRAFGEKMPSEQAFWDRIARDEEGHAKLIRGLDRVLARGHLFYNLGRFQGPEMAKAMNLLREALDTASGENLTRREAINTALSIEACFVEAEFYKVVESDAPEFAQLCRHLVEHSHRHLKQLCDHAAEIIAKDMAFQQHIAELNARIDQKVQAKRDYWSRFNPR